MSGDELTAHYAAQRFGGEAGANAPAPTPLYDLTELLEKPELLKPPPQVVPHFAWEGRLTLFAAGEKVGKSTLLGQAVAACVTGTEFLGEPPALSLVIWLALDEPVGDLVRRLSGHGLTGGVSVFAERPSLEELEAAITDRNVGLVVIDTLLEFGAGLVDDPNQAMQWQPILKALRGIAQRTGAAIVVLHHVNRSTGRYRDSSQLGAGVDCICEMSEMESDPALRKIRVRGRIQSERIEVRYIGGRYELEGGELPLDLKVYRAIESNPGVGVNKLRKAVGGKAEAVDEAVRLLMARGAIENRGAKNAYAYHVKPTAISAGPGLPVTHGGRSGSHEGHGAGTHPAEQVCPGALENDAWDTVSPVVVNADGHTGSREGHTSGHATVSRPPIRGGRGHGVVAGTEVPPCSLCGTAQKRTVHNTYRCPQCCPDNRWAA